MDASEYPVLLRGVVGSQAHGLARLDSDRDFREVYYVPTRELLALPASRRPKAQWGTASKFADDEGGWEVGHFLEMCLAGNPNVVELLWTTLDGEPTPEGVALRELAPSVLATGPILRAFLGYAENARRKIATDTLARVTKWTSTYLRILYTAETLFREGSVTYPVERYPWGIRLREAREGTLSAGAVVELGQTVEDDVRSAAERSVLRAAPDLEAVNAWLLDFRGRHFDA